MNFSIWRDSRVITATIGLITTVVILLVPELEGEQQYIQDNAVELITAIIVGGGVSWAFMREYFVYWLSQSERNDDLIVSAISMVADRIERQIEQSVNVNIPDVFRESLIREVENILVNAQKGVILNENDTAQLDVKSLDIKP